VGWCGFLLVGAIVVGLKSYVCVRTRVNILFDGE